MLVAAAVCPHPPLLVPGVGAGASGELEELRAACDAAVRALAETRPDLLVVVGSAESVGPFAPEAWGSLRGFGVDVPVGSGPGEPMLPLSLTIGRWLLDRNPVPCPALLFGVTEDAEPSRCLDLGATLAERASRVAVLAMGDGTALRTPKGPGYWDDRAEPFDTAVAEALAAGEPAALGDLDVALADELRVGGRAAWQVLAGAATTAAQPFTGQLTHHAAPYGVGYLVATLLPPAE